MTSNDARSMRAWLTSGDGIADLAPARTPVPAPGATEVLVRVTALALNYRDLLVINGIHAWKPASPVIPISDAAGVVVDAGPEATRFDVGDRLLPAFLPRWRTGPLTTENQVLPVGGPVNRGFLAEYAVIHEQEADAQRRSTSPTPEAATLPRRRGHRLALARQDRPLARRGGPGPRHRGRRPVRDADRPRPRRESDHHLQRRDEA